MLEEYGCDRLVFKKTGQTALDTDGTPLDVWMLSFTNEKERIEVTYMQYLKTYLQK